MSGPGASPPSAPPSAATRDGLRHPAMSSALRAPESVDLLVAGGGPAGLATAICASLAGLRAVVVEPKAGVIDKACGEGLMPPAVEALERLGVELPVSHPFRGVRYVSGGQSVEADFATGTGLGVRRLVLHAALQRRAADLGVETVQGKVAEIVQDAHGVEAAGIRARYLAVADGVRSPIRAQLGLQLPPRRPLRLGIRQHFEVAPWSPFVEVHWSDHAEAYVTPVAPDQVGLAFLFRAGPGGLPAGEGPPYKRLLRGFPELEARLGQPSSIVRGAGPFEQRVRRRVVGRALLVGDAAGYLDPLTGEGIRLGLECAGALVAAISADDPQRYEAAWSRIARRYWWMTSGLLLVARWRGSRRALVPVLRRAPWLMHRAVNMLAA